MCRHHGYRLCRCRGREHGECHNLLHYAECCRGHSYHIVYEDSDKLERHVDARILQCNGRSGFMDVPRLRPSPPSSSHTAVCPAFWRAPCLSPVSPDRIRGKWLLSCSSACFFQALWPWSFSGTKLAVCSRGGGRPGCRNVIKRCLRVTFVPLSSMRDW